MHRTSTPAEIKCGGTVVWWVKIYGIEWESGGEAYSVYTSFNKSPRQRSEMLEFDGIKELQRCGVWFFFVGDCLRSVRTFLYRKRLILLRRWLSSVGQDLSLSQASDSSSSVTVFGRSGPFFIASCEKNGGRRKRNGLGRRVVFIVSKHSWLWFFGAYVKYKATRTRVCLVCERGNWITTRLF